MNAFVRLYITLQLTGFAWGASVIQWDPGRTDALSHLLSSFWVLKYRVVHRCGKLCIVCRHAKL